MEPLIVPVLALLNPQATLTVVIGLGLVIFFHELGHFMVAKWCGVYVEHFSIGFGPSIISRKWGETEYRLGWIPLGGYVKMRGQDDMDPGEMTDEEVAQDPRSYTAKSVPQRMAIISAGVIMNLITGTIFFALAFTLGVETVVATVGEVKVGGPAWRNGIYTGDQITRINDRSINNFEDLMVNTALSRGPMNVQGRHADGTPFQIIVPAEILKSENDSRRKLGIAPAASLNLYQAKEVKDGPLADPATAAAAAGLQPGDTITAVSGVTVASHVEFLAEISRHAAEEVTLTVSRLKNPEGKERADAEVKLPAQHGLDLGFRMSMGKVSDLRTGGVAEKAGIKVGDRIAKIDGLLVENDLDPFRLTEYFSAHAGQEVTISLSREVEGKEPTSLDVTVIPEDRPAWSESPFTEDSPLSIPSLGMAYHIAPIVFSVDAEGPAFKQGIKKLDSVVKVSLVAGDKASGKLTDFLGKTEKYEIEIKEHNWAHAYWLMQSAGRSRKIELTVSQAGGENKVVEITPQENPDWFLQNSRGIQFRTETTVRQANDLAKATSMGADYTYGSVRQVYLTLRGLILGDISIRLMSGPIGIAQAAYQSAEVGISPFILFLGLISVNLAVVNFLPIPVLDGGHMVLLMWEGITRKKPNEKIVGIATYIGLSLLLTLIVVVVILDLFVSKT